MSLVKSIGKQKVNLDFNKDFINLFTQKIKLKDVKFINQTLADLHDSSNTKISRAVASARCNAAVTGR